MGSKIGIGGGGERGRGGKGGEGRGREGREGRERRGGRGGEAVYARKSVAPTPLLSRAVLLLQLA